MTDESWDPTATAAVSSHSAFYLKKKNNSIDHQFRLAHIKEYETIVIVTAQTPPVHRGIWQNWRFGISSNQV